MSIDSRTNAHISRSLAICEMKGLTKKTHINSAKRTTPTVSIPVAQYDLLFNKKDTLRVKCAKPNIKRKWARNVCNKLSVSSHCKQQQQQKRRLNTMEPPSHIWPIIKYHSILLCVHVRVNARNCDVSPKVFFFISFLLLSHSRPLSVFFGI